MDRAEFLDTLRCQLSGQMQDGKAAAHVRYYEDYIQSQVRGGRNEQEVLAELGDPRLIAKTLLDTDADDGQEIYGENYGEYSESGSSEQTSEVKKVHKLDLSTWYGKLIVVAIAAAVLALLITVIGAILPFVIVLFIVLYLISYFKKKK